MPRLTINRHLSARNVFTRLNEISRPHRIEIHNIRRQYANTHAQQIGNDFARAARSLLFSGVVISLCTGIYLEYTLPLPGSLSFPRRMYIQYARLLELTSNEGITYFDKGMEGDQIPNAELYKVYADLKRSYGQLEEAINLYSIASSYTTSSSTKAELAYSMAELYQLLNNNQKAKENYREAMDSMWTYSRFSPDGDKIRIPSAPFRPPNALLQIIISYSLLIAREGKEKAAFGNLMSLLKTIEEHDEMDNGLYKDRDCIKASILGYLAELAYGITGDDKITQQLLVQSQKEVEDIILGPEPENTSIYAKDYIFQKFFNTESKHDQDKCNACGAMNMNNIGLLAERNGYNAEARDYYARGIKYADRGLKDPAILIDLARNLAKVNGKTTIDS